jgi:O-antigen/teichoic acid export membrane protein
MNFKIFFKNLIQGNFITNPLLKDFIPQITILVIARGLSLVNSIKAIKTLGSYNIGYTNLLQTAAAQSSVLYDGGLNNVGIRMYSESKSPNLDYLLRILSFRLLIIAVFSVFWILTILLLKFEHYELWIITFLIIVNNALDLAYIFRCLGKYTTYMLISAINPILLFGLYFTLLESNNYLGIDLKLIIISTSVTLIISWLYFYFTVGIFPLKFFKINDYRELFNESKLMWANSAVGIFYPAFQIYLITLMLGIEQNGIYRASILFVVPIEMIMTTFIGIVLPHISKWKTNGIRFFKMKVKQTSFYLLLLFSPLLLLVYFANENIFLKLLGEDYVFSLIAFKILVFGKIFLIIFSIFSTSIIANRHDNFLLKSAIFIAIFNVTLNVILIPRFELLGAALATMISDILLPIFLLYKFMTIKEVQFFKQSND